MPLQSVSGTLRVRRGTTELVEPLLLVQFSVFCFTLAGSIWHLYLINSRSSGVTWVETWSRYSTLKGEKSLFNSFLPLEVSSCLECQLGGSCWGFSFPDPKMARLIFWPVDLSSYRRLGGAGVAKPQGL